MIYLLFPVNLHLFLLSDYKSRLEGLFTGSHFTGKRSQTTGVQLKVKCNLDNRSFFN